MGAGDNSCDMFDTMSARCQRFPGFKSFKCACANNIVLCAPAGTNLNKMTVCCAACCTSSGKRPCCDTWVQLTAAVICWCSINKVSMVMSMCARQLAAIACVFCLECCDYHCSLCNMLCPSDTQRAVHTFSAVKVTPSLESLIEIRASTNSC